MSRPLKPNETPRAPFNLRITGPMKPVDIRKRLNGKAFRTAHGYGKELATLDADPCPHCAAEVEWAPTTTKEGLKVVQYVYARCRGKQRHSWGFNNVATRREQVEIVDTTPTPRPSVGTEAMARWIDKKAEQLASQLKALEELKKLASYVVVGTPRPSPNGGEPHA